MEAKYKIHSFELDMKKDKDKDKLELFLNSLNGEIIAIIPNVQPEFRLMGASAVTKSLLIVEKIK